MAKNLLAMYREYTRGNSRRYFYMFLYAALILASPFIYPVINQLVFTGIATGSMGWLLALGGVLLAVTLLILLASYLLNTRADYTMISCPYVKTMPGVLARFYKMPYDKTRRQFEDGDVVNRIQEGVKGVLAVDGLLTRFGCTFLGVIAMGFYIAEVNIHLALVAGGVAIVDVLVLVAKVMIGYKAEKRVQDLESKREAGLHDLIEEMDFLQMNGVEQQQFSSYQLLQKKTWNTLISAEGAVQLLGLAGEGVAVTGRSLLLGIIAPFVQAGAFTIAVAAAMLSSFAGLRSLVSDLTNNLTMFPRMMVPARRLIELFAEDSVEEETIAPQVWQPGQECLVSLKGISYEAGGKKLLDSATLEIRQGEKIALVGKNGCGKSTLMRVMLGLYQGQGRMLVPGIGFAGEINNLSYAPAKSQLFSEPVAENIRAGCLAQTDRDIAEAVAVSCLEPEAVEKEFCKQLSGGQAQRVNLARAAAGQGSLAVLDEPTASLDAETSAKVAANLVAYFDTMLMITHDPNLLALFDRIVVMEKGSITFSGNLNEAKGTAAFQAWQESIQNP